MKARPIRWNLGDVGVEYARYHQRGTGSMPARPFFLDPSQEELAPVLRRAKELVVQELKKYYKRK